MRDSVRPHFHKSPLWTAILLIAPLFLACYSPPLMAQPGGVTIQHGGNSAAPGSIRAMPAPIPLSTAIAWAKQEDLCLTPVSLKVEDATVDDIVNQLKTQLPSLSKLELRIDNPARFSLDLPHAPLAKILQAAATLMGGNLYVFSDHLLITTANQLGDDERGEAREWTQAASAGGMGWSARSQARNRIIETLAGVMGKPKPEPPQPQPGHVLRLEDVPIEPLKTLQVHYGDLSPEAQYLLSQLVQWPTRTTAANSSPATPLHFQNDTVITVSYNDLYTRLEVQTPLQPNPYVWENGMSPEFRQFLLTHPNPPTGAPFPTK